MKKLIPALVLLLISAMVLVTASYAWFSMNNKVTVTGMEVKTKVSDSLYVAASAAGENKVADSEFKSGLNQVVTGTLQPVSTISGLEGSFFTTTDATIDGRKASSSAIVPYTVVSGSTVTIDSTDYKAFVDYVFELKAVNTSESPKYVSLSKVNLLYQGSVTTNHAFRVAVFAQEQDDTDTTLDTATVADAYKAMSTTAANTILAPTGFAYFDNTAVSSTAVKAAVAPVVNNAGWSSVVGAGKTLYYKITVRLWLEGEDTDCYNTKFVGLDDNWQLDLAFILDTAAGAASSIGSAVNATIDNGSNTTTFTAVLENGETVATYQWYKADGTVISGQTANVYTADSGASISVYCKITTTEGNVYYTPVGTYTKAP